MNQALPATETDIENLVILLPSVHALYKRKGREGWSEVDFLRSCVKVLADERQHFYLACLNLLQQTPGRLTMDDILDRGI